MSNALATFTKSAVPAASGLAALAALGATSKRKSGDMQYLTFSKFGVWTYGQDKQEAEPDDEFAVNPNSFTCGYIAWENKKVVGERMNPITVGMPKLEEMEEGLPWQDQLGVSLKMIGGDEVSLEYKSSTTGGKSAITAIAEAISRRAVSAPESCIPLVRLTKSSYDHKTYGKILTPVLDVIGWLDNEGNVVERC